MAGNHFGRNQKRKLKAKIAEQEKFITGAERKYKSKDNDISRAKYILQTLYKLQPNHPLFDPAMPYDKMDITYHSNMSQNPRSFLDLTAGDSEPVMMDIYRVDLYKLEACATQCNFNGAITFEAAYTNPNRGDLRYATHTISAEALYFARDYEIATVANYLAHQLLKQLATNPKHGNLVRSQIIEGAPKIENFINEL